MLYVELKIYGLGSINYGLYFGWLHQKVFSYKSFISFKKSFLYMT